MEEVGKAESLSSKEIGSGGIEEISSDLLKNTPLNIARYEDAIEQCKGRQKYLQHTMSPSDGSDVRWYFCKVPLAENELAASVPKKETVGKNEYFRFGMRDSLAIEASFLQREEECLSSWWKEYAECSVGPKVLANSSNKLGSDKKSTSSESAQSSFYTVEEERVGVPVKGGLYEVDVMRRQSFPVYWNGDNRRVLRGHWFARKGGIDWLPLREDVSEQLELAYSSQVWHRRTFQPSGLFAARVDLQGSTLGLHALFTGEDDTWEAWLIGDGSVFSSVVSLSGNGTKLRRGYTLSQSPKPTQEELRQQKEEEMDDYCSRVPVRHVVFMVHGIGQRLEKSNLVDDVGTFRHITADLAERHLTPYQRGTQRVLYIPCQWRRDLKLGGETAVENITLDGVRGLRVMLSATVHDVLYYMSPIYCQDIINSVSNQLNRLYLQFLKRNPGYEGKVSIYGHSLGSVLSYDILCHQENLSSPFPTDWMYRENSYKDSQSSVCKTNLEDENANIIVKNKASVNIKNEEKVNAQLSVLDPAMLDLNEPSVPGLDSNQLNCHENICQSGCNTGAEVSERKNVLDKEKYISSRFEISDSEKVTNEEVELSDRNLENQFLKEKIDSLKARVAELESMSCGKDIRGLQQGNNGVVATVQEPGEDDAPKSYTPYIKYTKLEFKVDTFFAVGSPIGVFLALRNIRIGMGKGSDYWGEKNITEEMPACRRIFNIFHPFDPVAYRIEPLICKDYINRRPVIIPYHKGGKRLHIGLQELAEDLSVRSQSFMDRLYSIRVKVLTVCQSRDRDRLEEAAEASTDKERRSYGLTMMERLTGSEDGRVDHVLQDKTFEHAYISAIGSHTNYWRDYDTALFILKHLYQEIPDSTNLHQDSDGGGLSKNKHSWSEQSERVEEELPLTFSDSNLVRTFSRKAKKNSKKR